MSLLLALASRVYGSLGNTLTVSGSPILVNGSPITLGGIVSNEGDDTLIATSTAGGVSGRTGVLAVTEAGDTVLSTSVLPIAGVLNQTEGNDTVGSTSTLLIQGVTNSVEADDTVLSTSTLSIKGVVSVTELDDTLGSTATLAIKGVLAQTELEDTLSAQGISIGTNNGALAVTEGNDTLQSYMYRRPYIRVINDPSKLRTNTTVTTGRPYVSRAS